MIINELFTNYFLWYLKKKNKSLFFGRYGTALQEEGGELLGSQTYSYSIWLLLLLKLLNLIALAFLLITSNNRQNNYLYI